MDKMNTAARNQEIKQGLWKYSDERCPWHTFSSVQANFLLLNLIGDDVQTDHMDKMNTAARNQEIKQGLWKYSDERCPWHTFSSVQANETDADKLTDVKIRVDPPKLLVQAHGDQSEDQETDADKLTDVKIRVDPPKLLVQAHGDQSEDQVNPAPLKACKDCKPSVN
uniref:Uncharacterized protein n=1 Tax=Oryza nivara TaxID=4536 RepID=A0A0E0GZ87_ORYNI